MKERNGGSQQKKGQKRWEQRKPGKKEVGKNCKLQFTFRAQGEESAKAEEAAAEEEEENKILISQGVG